MTAASNSEARKRLIEAQERAECPLSQPIPAPVDSGAIGRLNEAERAALVDSFRASTRSPEHLAFLVEPVVERIVREHTDRALAEVESVVASRREAFLSSPNLDPAWIAGWHSAVDDVTNSVRAARQEQGR